MSALSDYIDAWKQNDPAAIVATVSPDVVVIEGYGPVYRGAPTVLRWAESWLAAGGRVLGWTITNEFTAGDRIAVEWRFECHWTERTTPSTDRRSRPSATERSHGSANTRPALPSTTGKDDGTTGTFSRLVGGRDLLYGFWHYAAVCFLVMVPFMGLSALSFLGYEHSH